MNQSSSEAEAHSALKLIDSSKTPMKTEIDDVSSTDTVDDPLGMECVSIHPKKRRSYDVDFKLEVAKFAQTASSRVTGRKYGVNEKLVRNWKRDIEGLQKLPKGTTTRFVPRSSQWPQLEGKLCEWIEAQSKKGNCVRSKYILAKALWIAKQDNISDFQGTSGWLQGFKKRYSKLTFEK